MIHLADIGVAIDAELLAGRKPVCCYFGVEQAFPGLSLRPLAYREKGITLFNLTQPYLRKILMSD